ncbi:MAG TPA: HAD-IA family hydrolase [Thermoanaerobaculia bacterium]|nr:HAD-IA family hydrolase [Thermoanaerobaculia bacterium]
MRGPAAPPDGAAHRRPYDLLVFDWDGTVMDSVDSIVACTRATVAELGLAPMPEERIRETIGLGMGETIERLAPDATAAEAARVLECFRRLWIETYRHRLVLFAGATGLLDDLADAGYLLAVATAKSRRGLDHDLAVSGLAGRFHATRTADEAFSKPHPKMLLDLLDELGVAASRALMVGDAVWDLQMAANAGVPALAVCSGACTRDELLAHGPLACLPGITELAGWLEGATPAPAGPAATTDGGARR